MNPSTTALAWLGFELQRPSALLGLVLVVLLVALGLWSVRARLAGLARLVHTRQRARFVPGFSTTRATLRALLAAAAAFFLVVALAGPVRGWTEREVPRTGLDLVVCVDTSRSMLVQDLQPDRLTRARREVKGLLGRLSGDRAALIAFAGDPRDVAPLTHDTRTLAALVGELVPEENLRGGTDLGAALTRALELFDGRTGAHEAVVLLTDGEDLEGKGLEVARSAKERGIRVFVVGMGTAAGARIPERRPDGSSGWVRDVDGSEVVSALDGSSLEKISELTGGAYLSVEQSPTPLEDLYQHRIRKLIGRQLGSERQRVPHDRFQWFGVLAAVCLLLEAGLRERRPRGWRRGASLAAALVCVPLLGEGELELPRSPRAALEQAQLETAAGRPENAHELAAALLARSAWSEPEEAEIRFNLAVIGEELARAAVEAQDSQAFESRRTEVHENLLRVRSLAGQGPLRLDATYNLGTLTLADAEALRLTLPEVRQAESLPPLEPPSDGAPEEDPLPAVRAAYTVAQDWLVERLQADWRDEDTRANLEWIQRRFAELDEIERQREQEQQQDPDQKQDPQDGEGDPNQDGEPQDGESQEDTTDPQESEQPPEDQEGEENSESDPSETEPPEEQPPEDAPGDSPGENEEQEGQETQPPPQGGEPTEQHLTREEMLRLLDQLQKIEEEARAMEARVRSRRRPPVKRDW